MNNKKFLSVLFECPQYTFEDFTKRICNRKILDSGRRYLIHVNIEPSIKNVKILYSAYVISIYPDYVFEAWGENSLNIDAGETDNECFNQAKQVVHAIKTATPAKVKDAFSLFNIIFNIWKSKDHQELINAMTICYREWNSVLETINEIDNEETKNIWGREIENHKNNIRQKIISLGGIDPDALPAPKVIDVDAMIQEEGNKKYWDDFAAELRMNQFSRIIVLIDEIKKRLIALNSSQEVNISEILDTTLIAQMIEYQVFNGDEFIKLFNNICELIRTMQCADWDADWGVWQQSVMEKIYNSQNDGLLWCNILPEIFNKILIQLDMVEDHVHHVRNILK